MNMLFLSACHIVLNLTRIAETLAQGDNRFFNDVLPWIVALIIGVLSALVNWQISKRHLQNSKELVKLEINASNISNKRQIWITELRDRISDLISIRLSLTYKIKYDKIGDTKLYEIPEYLGMISKVTELELMLNPNESDSQLLIQNIRKFVEVTNNDFFELSFETSSIIDITKRILKSEWERVKRGE